MALLIMASVESSALVTARPGATSAAAADGSRTRRQRPRARHRLYELEQDDDEQQEVMMGMDDGGVANEDALEDEGQTGAVCSPTS